jgi:hypothetical protein
MNDADIERFNCGIRCELHDAWALKTVADVHALRQICRVRYNTGRAHDAPGRVPPYSTLRRSR